MIKVGIINEEAIHHDDSSLAYLQVFASFCVVFP